jgi:hypothetical protein
MACVERLLQEHGGRLSGVIPEPFGTMKLLRLPLVAARS